MKIYMKWKETHNGYHELYVNDVFMASITAARGKTFICTTYCPRSHEESLSKTFSSHGLLKITSIEFNRAKKWCEEKCRLISYP